MSGASDLLSMASARIKELEAEVKTWQANSVDLEYKCLDKNLRNDELTAKLDKAKEALEDARLELGGWVEIGGKCPESVYKALEELDK